MNQFITLISLLLLAGCSRDISHDSRYKTDYVIGATYRVLRPLVVKEVEHDAVMVEVASEWELGLIAKTGRGQTQNTVGSVPPSTLIRLETLVYETNLEAGNTIWVKGRFLNGRFAKKEVELLLVSKREGPTHLGVPQVDTNVLQKVKEP